VVRPHRGRGVETRPRCVREHRPRPSPLVSHPAAGVARQRHGAGQPARGRVRHRDARPPCSRPDRVAFQLEEGRSPETCWWIPRFAQGEPARHGRANPYTMTQSSTPSRRSMRSDRRTAGAGGLFRAVERRYPRRSVLQKVSHITPAGRAPRIRVGRPRVCRVLM
jgi:hypothetical protein